MEQSDYFRARSTSKHTLQQRWRFAWIFLSILVVVLLLTFYRAKISPFDPASVLLLLLVAALCVVIVFHTRFLLQARSEHRESEGRFQQMASNIQEIFWMIDAETKEALYVNEAYETITGYARRTLEENPSSYADLIHPEDRSWVMATLDAATQTGEFDERFRIRLPNGETRWVWVRGFPVRHSNGRIYRLVGTAQDITAHKHAEEQVAQNLAVAESARAEADALRKATLALTQDLHMDYVLDTLLQCLAELVPCESAQVLLVESGTRLFLAREKLCRERSKIDLVDSLTLDAGGIPLLRGALTTQKSILVTNTEQERQWRPLMCDSATLSWLCVPLVASQQVLGLLSLAHNQPSAFTREHLRRAELLAIPAAVAIQNARLYERTEIYSAELERRLEDLRQAQDALSRTKGTRGVS